VGFNMSWILVDEIDQDALLAALDLVPTGETPDRYDLGTSHVPLAAATFNSGWCAVFAKYALVMDATLGTEPPRLIRLPAQSRAITCVTLEHAMVSYASLWSGGRYIWQVKHNPRHGVEHLETSGDLPTGFSRLHDIALQKQRADSAIRQSGSWGVDHIFDVPLDTAATITGFRHDRSMGEGAFRTLQSLAPADGNVLTKLSDPPKWWQTVGSTEYR
jgi:hypothetical protein